jgi:hypothetical protein
MAQAWVEKLKQQEWAQDIQGRWAALDPSMQRGLMIGFLGGGLLIAVVSVVMIQSSVFTVRSEVRENEELTDFIQKASEERRRMKGSGAFAADANGQGAQEFLAQQLASELLRPDSITVQEKRAMPPNGQLQETLVKLSIDGLSLRGFVMLTNALERPSIPLKLRALDAKQNEDKSALQVSLALSEFQVIQK